MFYIFQVSRLLDDYYSPYLATTRFASKRKQKIDNLKKNKIISIKIREHNRKIQFEQIQPRNKRFSRSINIHNK